MAFTGLVYKYLDAPTLKTAQWKWAQNRVRVLSGLYGLLRPLDEVEAYRLEMGSKVNPKGSRNLTEFWRKRLTETVNKALKKGEPILSVASQEYMKALDLKQLIGPVVSPVFKERLPDGSLRNAPVHSKMARGALTRYALITGARKPRDLLGFRELGWEAAEEPPDSGRWLFVRTYRG